MADKKCRICEQIIISNSAHITCGIIESDTFTIHILRQGLAKAKADLAIAQSQVEVLAPEVKLRIEAEARAVSAEKERDELRAENLRIGDAEEVERVQRVAIENGAEFVLMKARAEKAEASLVASQERVRELEDKAKRVVVRHLAGDGFLLVGAINRLADALSPKPQEGNDGR